MMGKARGIKKCISVTVLVMTLVCSLIIPQNSYAAKQLCEVKQPWYEASIKQVTDFGIASPGNIKPSSKVKAEDFLKMAVLWFTYNHGEDYKTVVKDLGWVKDGEILS
ncbi:MAG: hypothetical protein Q8942_16065, partial [Bacillota bacterium]|nr:hypothetical protein [Bacillota bacterium]